MRHKPSPATVIACVALFFSLGGVGLAAAGQGAEKSPYFMVRLARVSHHHPYGTAIAECHSGDNALSGGFLAGTNVTVTTELSYPYAPDPFKPHVRHPAAVPAGWSITAALDPNRRGAHASFYAWAICG